MYLFEHIIFHPVIKNFMYARLAIIKPFSLIKTIQLSIRGKLVARKKYIIIQTEHLRDV